MTAQINIFLFPFLRVSVVIFGLIENVKVEDDGPCVVRISRSGHYVIDYTHSIQSFYTPTLRRKNILKCTHKDRYMYISHSRLELDILS